MLTSFLRRAALILELMYNIGYRSDSFRPTPSSEQTGNITQESTSVLSLLSRSYRGVMHKSKKYSSDLTLYL